MVRAGLPDCFKPDEKNNRFLEATATICKVWSRPALREFYRPRQILEGDVTIGRDYKLASTCYIYTGPGIKDHTLLRNTLYLSAHLDSGSKNPYVCVREVLTLAYRSCRYIAINFVPTVKDSRSNTCIECILSTRVKSCPKL